MGPAQAWGMAFVGRQAELGTLEEQYAAPGSSFVPIYGRRRVGKSELILRFAEAKPALYYVGKTAPPALQMEELGREAARVLGEPLLASSGVTDWKRLLINIVERHRGPQKLVLALDEFQWLAHASPELPGVLQDCWDNRWRRAGNVMLILCGSYVGFMEREVLGKRSPLFGRRTAQIKLLPFGYREAQDFHPSWSLVERARAYFVCGGVPTYLTLFDPARSVEQNIESVILGEFGPLFREPDFLLREELREVDNYYALLVAVANGHATSSQIAAASGLPERSLHYYLQQLSELGYIGRRSPLTGSRPSQRQVRYSLEDPLLRFWFRFVFPNLSYLQQAGPNKAFRERIRPELDAYFGTCFERLCREALGRLYVRDGVNAPFSVGEYWSKDTQIDVVGLREDGVTDIGECKWGAVRSVPKLLDELSAKAGAYPNLRGATIKKHLFVRERPPKEHRDSKKQEGSEATVKWHDLADLYR
ncbi:MAG: ATP-binding protein [Polyangiaceae bacterium]|nr:ATP-binding protein [Polyangiaceae bacterium]